MNNLRENKEVQNILLTTFISDFVILTIGYFLVPIILNYPPYSLEKAFQIQAIGITYNTIFAVFVLIYVVFNFITTYLYIKPLIGYQKILRKKDIDIDEIQLIRTQCMKSPIKIYTCQVLLPFFAMIFASLIFKLPFSLFLKLTVLLEMFMIADGLYCYVINKKYYDKIIIKTYNRIKDYEFVENELYSLKNSIFIQIFPLFFVAVLLSIFLGYTRATNERGESKYYYYQSKFPKEILQQEKVDVEYMKEMLSKITLKEEKDYYFILAPNNNAYISSENGSVSVFFKTYVKKYYDKTNGKGYEFYSVDEQSFVKKILDEHGEEWYIGFKYTIVDEKVLIFLGVSFICLILIYITIIYIWAKGFSLSIKRVVRNLNDILKENTVDFDNVIPITSYDEIGVLADTYNKLQDMIENQIELLEKQAQLATLGELAGNMAHDINTPLASVDNSLSMLKNMAESKDKVDSRELLIILGIMEKCTDKVNKIVNSMRNQVRTLGNNDIIEFNLKNVIEESIIMLNSDILQINCNIVCKMKDVKIKGEPSKISQVITSILMNSLQAYKSKELYSETIEIKLTKEKNYAVIEIKDYAKGIPEAIKPYIFKNILTIKGTNGTGLGLYLSYSIIKGVFGGMIEFDSITGVGTTFRIELPL